MPPRRAAAVARDVIFGSPEDDLLRGRRDGLAGARHDLLDGGAGDDIVAGGRRDACPTNAARSRSPSTSQGHGRRPRRARRPLRARDVIGGTAAESSADAPTRSSAARARRTTRSGGGRRRADRLPRDRRAWRRRFDAQDIAARRDAIFRRTHPGARSPVRGARHVIFVVLRQPLSTSTRRLRRRAGPGSLELRAGVIGRSVLLRRGGES